MLICAILRTAISTGTKNRAFGLLQNKPNQTQFKPKTNPIKANKMSKQTQFQPKRSRPGHSGPKTPEYTWEIRDNSFGFCISF